jgi:hypothetical protein
VRRVVRVLYWLVPIAFCIWLYWMGARIWFSKDDFAWLGLKNHVTDFRSFLWAMFHPFAQGTIRPWSERGFFMLFSWFFGLRALPYRLFVFANQFLNIILVIVVARKLTKSQLAGFVAPLLWVANPALLIPMTWTASYNEIQCTTFLLLAFYLFIRYTETGERKYYWGQWAAFVLGFGSLEIIVVYPAIVAVYAFLFARRCVLSTLPLFAASALYALVHRIAAGAIPGGFYYDMDFHVGTLLSTLKQYRSILLGVPAYFQFREWSSWKAKLLAWLLTAAILAFAAWQARKRRFLPLFCLCWFAIVLAPLLPLHNHVTEYYLTMPAIGIAILGAYGLTLAFRKGWLPTAAVAVLLLVYLIPSSRLVRAQIITVFDGTDRVRGLVQSVAYAKRIHPGKMILLRNVDDNLFWASVYDSPFRIFGWNDVFMTPDCRPNIREDPNLGDVDVYFLPEKAVAHVLHDGGAVVYSVEDRRLRNVTKTYTALVDSQPPPPLSRSINVASRYFDDQIGEGWFDLEGSHRWSRGHAVVYLAGPASPGKTVYVSGHSTEEELRAGPLHLTLTIDGRPQPVQTVNSTEFEFSYALPQDLVGRTRIEVAFTVDRTTRLPSDGRDLGLAFGEFNIR